ncbi:MAG TPA: F0F1 ATP synthase subunit B, partial [Allosphingosinicella sp.]|nr:F0F1 ATP synthase subunit B [Allosphingosinicella sp.]
MANRGVTDVVPSGAQAAENVSQAAELEGLPHAGSDAVSSTEAHGGSGEHHVDPTALGLNATAWVALAMLVVIALLLWKKVPAAIGRALDKKIAGIREQLDEAAQLRAEAEAIKAEYEAKAAQAGAEAELMLERARDEADAIVAQANT